jgi:outer membrane protein, heavy metal efflux system
MRHVVVERPRSYLLLPLLFNALTISAQVTPGPRPDALPATTKTVAPIEVAPLPVATPPSLRLSRQQAIAEALARNPALAAARAQVEEARAQVVMAAAYADPSFLTDVTGQSNPLRPGSATARDQGIGVTVPFPGKTALRRDVATAALRAAEFNVTQLQQQIASQTAQAYDAILVALRHREDLQQARELASDFVQKTQARFMAGTVARVDVIKAKTDLASAENDLIANERASATARATLNRLLGRMGGAPIETTDALDVPPGIAAVDTLERIAESSRPEVQSLAAQLEGASKATRLARQFWAPDFNLTLTHSSTEGSPSTYTSGLSIGVPIFFWQHQRGEVAQARHREEELSANVADIRAQVSLDVQTAYAATSTALRQAIFIRDQLLPEAREVYRVASVSYGLGGSSALDLLDAKRTLLDAQRQYIDALGAANDALAALELAIGAPLPPPAPGEQR